MNDLAYVQYNKKLRKRFESCFNGKEVDPIILENLEDCVEWLMPCNARDDVVLGTDFTFGTLEEVQGMQDGEENNDPPLTRQYKRRGKTQAQDGTSTSTQPSKRARLQELHDDDDDDEGSEGEQEDAEFNLDGESTDGLLSGEDEDY